MRFSRRDLFIGGAGACAGLLLTPVPWKLLGDTSIWTQNWPWIPQPTHRPIETKYTACTLCPAGCGMRVRMGGGWPVGVSGNKNHPVTMGALCPLAFAAHQLNWHPLRLREVRHHGQTSSWTEAQKAFARACSEGPIVVIDGRPGRAASLALETFARKMKGGYQVVLSKEVQALVPYAKWSGLPVSALGFDLANTETIISFGAPLLDGWGVPGNFTRLWSDRAAGSTEPHLRLIQIESSLSRTGSRAWKWFAVREGSGAAVAQGIARVLLEEHLVRAPGPLPQMTLEEASAKSGLNIETIRDLARTIVESRPALAIAEDGGASIAALNVVLGTVGVRGGITRNQAEGLKASGGSDVSSPRALLIDSSVPSEFVPPNGAEVFRFAAWDGGGSKTDWLLPAPGFAEEFSDVPTAPGLALKTYTIAANLTTPDPQCKTAAQFLGESDSSLPDSATTIQKRCNELFHARKGAVYGEQVAAVGDLESAQKLGDALRNGSIWVDDTPRDGSFRCELNEWPAQDSATFPPRTWDSDWSPPVLPPLAAKLFQESTLRDRPARRAV